MAKKAAVDKIALLSEGMLRALASLRERGDGSYPPTLRQLAEQPGGPYSDDHVVKAAGKKTFTARAVTEKVDKKPSLDAPVYFKEDVPDPVTVLAGKMLHVLKSQRTSGNGTYPPTLGHLAGFCNIEPKDKRVSKAIAHKSMTENVIVAGKGKTGLDSPVILKDDIEGEANAILPALLRFALRPVTTKIKRKDVETTAFTPAELTKKFVERLAQTFSDALDGGIARRDLPPDVAWIVIKGEARLFLRENLRSGNRIPTAPVDGPTTPPLDPLDSPRAPATRDFAAAFRHSFNDLDKRNGASNFVRLSDLRRALSEFDRAEFDAGLRQLRLDREFSLNSHEGLHRPLTPEEREAGIQEAGSLLVYVSRRERP